MAKHGLCKKYSEQLFSIIAFGKSHWKQDAAQGNKPILAGDIALDILLVQMVILGSPTPGPKLLGCHKFAHGIGLVQFSILNLFGK